MAPPTQRGFCFAWEKFWDFILVSEFAKIAVNIIIQFFDFS